METVIEANAVATSCRDLIAALTALDEPERILALNAVREALHAVSPFRAEPIDCVLWVPATAVQANDYNPNTVATPEMRLLELSIASDGYTQPVVVCDEAMAFVTVDGFHRTRVGKESAAVQQRTHGYLPITRINPDRAGRVDRIAATIRHNRARGKHGVEAMSAIVLDLSRRAWSDAKIAKELGMEPDEVLRLKQITGLAELFKDRDFSEAWDVD